MHTVQSRDVWLVNSRIWNVQIDVWPVLGEDAILLRWKLREKEPLLFPA